MKAIAKRLRRLEDEFGSEDGKRRLTLVVCPAGWTMALDTDRSVEILGECGFVRTGPGMLLLDGTEDYSLRTATQRDRKVSTVTRCGRLIVNHRSVSSFTSTPEASVLPSADVTRHPRSYDPIRLPVRPSPYR